MSDNFFYCFGAIVIINFSRVAAFDSSITVVVSLVFMIIIGHAAAAVLTDAT